MVELAELRTPDGVFLIQERRSRPRDPSMEKPAAPLKPATYTSSPQMMGLGGLIIIGVLVGSYTTKYDAAIGHAGGALAIPAVGFLALQLFLARAALRLFDDVRSYESVPEYVVSRIFRYAPAVVPAVALGFLVRYVAAVPGMKADGSVLAANFFMVADMVGIGEVDASHWRLKIEIFQAVLIAMAWFGPARRHIASLLAIGLAVTACTLHGEPSRSNMLTVQGVLTCDGYLPLFAFGIALYHLVADRRSAMWRTVLVIATVLAFASNTPIHGAWTVAALAVLAAITTGRLQWLGHWRWLAHLGEIAFPIYVVHYVAGFAVIHHLERLGCPAVLASLAASAVAIAAGKALNAYVERPLQARGVVATKAVRSALDSMKSRKTSGRTEIAAVRA